MSNRALPLNAVLACLALAAFIAFSGAALAEDKDSSHQGKVVSAAKGKLTMTDENGKEHSHIVSKTAKIMRDGEAVKLEDLKKGTKITVTTKKGDPTTAVRIEAQTKQSQTR